MKFQILLLFAFLFLFVGGKSDSSEPKTVTDEDGHKYFIYLGKAAFMTPKAGGSEKDEDYENDEDD
jgi:hypothetical protein